MNISIGFDFFLAAESEKSKEKIVNKIGKALDDIFKPGVVRQGDRCFQVNICCESWELSVYSALQACQMIGRQWVLTGDINFEFSAWTNCPKLVGVESIGVTVSNPRMATGSTIDIEHPGQTGWECGHDPTDEEGCRKMDNVNAKRQGVA